MVSFSLLLQLHQSLHCLLNRGLAAKAVDVEEINAIGAKLLQTLFTRSYAVLWCAVDREADLSTLADGPA